MQAIKLIVVCELQGNFRYKYLLITLTDKLSFYRFKYLPWCLSSCMYTYMQIMNE